MHRARGIDEPVATGKRSPRVQCVIKEILDVRAIVSNHRDFYQLAASYNIPFHHIPVTAAT